MKKNRMILAFAVGAIALNVATVSMSIAWYANSIVAYVEPEKIAIVKMSYKEIILSCRKHFAIFT